MIQRKIVALLLCVCLHLSLAAIFQDDSQTTLLLRFNNSLQGADAETPLVASGISFATGLDGTAAKFTTGATLTYAANNEISATEGTLEFFCKPTWTGGDNGDHYFLSWGLVEGMLFGKDGANNLRSIFNRISQQSSEVGTAYNLSSEWSDTSQWHYVAYTWSSDSLKLYVDGQPKDAKALSQAIITPSESSFHIGSDRGSKSCEALIDELRISSSVRTASEIAQVASKLPLTNIPKLHFYVPAMNMPVGYTYTTGLYYETIEGTEVKRHNYVPSLAFQWHTDNSAIATVTAEGVVQAISTGTTVLHCVYDTMHLTANITVYASRSVEEFPLDSYLQTPAAGAIYDVPVLMVTYVPTSANGRVDSIETNCPGRSVEELVDWVHSSTEQTKFMLEEGSKFRGYADPLTTPSLGYRVVKHLVIREPAPEGFAHPGEGKERVYFPDYIQMYNRINLEYYVESLGVKEVWTWGYHYGHLEPVESNMSSPLTGDISNSNRFSNDLPIYSSSYTSYNYSYASDGNLAVHDHGHQLEAILDYLNVLEHGNSTLFRDTYCDRGTQVGRCGDVHYPPNVGYGTGYIYKDTTATVACDCEDWSPYGGVQHSVNAFTWYRKNYPWPNGNFPGSHTNNPDHMFGSKAEAHYYIWWMQNMPGLNNTIVDTNGRSFTNWWDFTGDWDAAIRAGQRLTRNSSSTHTISLSVAADTTDPGGSCSAPGWQSDLVYWGGDSASYNGKLYVAAWWTRGDIPTNGGVWSLLGECGGSPQVETHGTISPFGEVTVNDGDSLLVAITPDSGYTVAALLIDGQSQSGSAQYTFRNVQADHSIVAFFTEDSTPPLLYTITATTTNGGSLSPSGITSVVAGASQTFTATAETGFVLDSLLVDGLNVGTSPTYTFNAISEDHQITAYFSAPVIPLYTITASAEAGGTISPVGAVSVVENGSQSFSISANSGYKIDDVTVDGLSVGAVTVYTFTTVMSNHTIAASFTENSTGGPCDGVTDWDPAQNWTEYAVGDKRINGGKLYECINPTYSYYEPSGPWGHYGWSLLGSCN